MDVTADQAEFFDFPVLEERSAPRSVLAQIKKAMDEHGMLFPQYLVVSVLGLSRQRVSKLIEEGKLASVEIDGKNYIPAVALEFFLTEERKAGRPWDQPASVAEGIKRGVRAAKAELAKRKK